MAYRNSLKKCLRMMAYQLRANNYEFLTIVCNTRGKYYTLHDDAEMNDIMDQPANKIPRVVCCLTLNELRSFRKNVQLALDLQGPPND